MNSRNARIHVEINPCFVNQWSFDIEFNGAAQVEGCMEIGLRREIEQGKFDKWVYRAVL